VPCLPSERRLSKSTHGGDSAAIVEENFDLD
jgi:hypothetical protein